MKTVCLLTLSILLCASAGAQKTPAAQKSPIPATKKPSDPAGELLARGVDAIEKNEFSKAVAELEKYVAARPDDAYGHFQLAYALTGLERAAEAIPEYRRAIALDEKLGPAHLNLGLLLLNREPQAAVGPLEAASRMLPGQARPIYLLGTALERSGKLDAAIENYQAAAKLEPRDPDVALALGRALLASRRSVEAEGAFRTVLGLPPSGKEVAARLGLAESLIHQHRLAEAASELAVYVRAKPEDLESRLQLASVYTDLEKTDEALAELVAARAAGERSFAGQKLRADLLLKMKRFPEAAEALQEALRAADDPAVRCDAPCRAELHASLGRVWLEKRDFPAAERELLAARRLSPDLNEPLRDLVAVYYLANNFAATLAALDDLARLEQPTAGTWFVRATSCDKLGRKGDALAAYKKFVELDQGRSVDRDFQARQRIRILTRMLEKK